jgi:3-polyprenyl-4-hydroxybenzoate decarboxylase
MRQVSFRTAAHSFQRLAHQVEKSGEPVTVIIGGKPAIIIEPALPLSTAEKRALAKRLSKSKSKKVS